MIRIKDNKAYGVLCGMLSEELMKLHDLNTYYDNKKKVLSSKEIASLTDDIYTQHKVCRILFELKTRLIEECGY